VSAVSQNPESGFVLAVLRPSSASCSWLVSVAAEMTDAPGALVAIEFLFTDDIISTFLVDAYTMGTIACALVNLDFWFGNQNL